MVLLPGICMGVILLGGGGKGWSHTGLLQVSCAGREDPWGRAPAGLHHLLLQSRAMAQRWHCQLHSGAALGAQSRAPPGWVLAHPPVEEGMSGSSLIWGQAGGFGAWCLSFCGMGCGMGEAQPCLCCRLITEVSPPSHGSRAV